MTSSHNDTVVQFGQDRPVTITEADGSQTELAKFNTGASVQDTQVLGEQAERLTSWYERNGIVSGDRVQIVKLSHMRYQHPDLEVITTFLRDFGMHVVRRTDTEAWFRGYGPDQYCYYARLGEKAFLGGTFEVESQEELVKASQIAGAGKIEDLHNAPGGGKMVTLHDAEGFPVNLIYGQNPASKGDLPEKLIYNDESDKPRVRQFHRFRAGAAAVHKLGHFGLCVQDFDTQMAWYTKHFNFAPSDILYVPLPDSGSKGTAGPQTKDVAVFAHIDRGEVPVDHHSFFMTTNATSHVHHASFEVHDYDTQHLGHQWLGKQGYTSVWGIGRHILGSQIFDYWWDPHGFMIEHYADGDLVNHETPVGRMPAGHESLAVWGPEVPKTFLE
ncbi:hypothetical protein AMS68_001153 [Peltaster fructicola]|uniref:VOC domain-containing protein n=1 Tax=Peltaster fructicola TaxID=286661 RepID=A0A6H0XLQ4_9PEZI|nr:hypothetical protein AMS68_001153 [Peltaster fructicola]